MAATSAKGLAELLEAVNEATVLLRRAQEGVPQPVEALVEGLDRVLHAEAPWRLEVDPYRSTILFAAALRAVKALRHDDPARQRRELRLALEQFRHTLRDIIEARPVGADRPVRDVLATLAETLRVPQPAVADLVGVSGRQLQRWLAPQGPTPAGDDEARIRAVAQIVNQLRHVFTAPGVVAWFHRPHPRLGTPPAELLDDPLRYPELVDLATAARVTTG